MTRVRQENPLARPNRQSTPARGDQVDGQLDADSPSSLCLGDVSASVSRSDDSAALNATLRELLVQVGDDPKCWRGRAGRRVGEILISEARAMSSRWRHAGGTVDGVAVGGAWEAIMQDRERLACDPDASPLAAIRSALMRSYAVEVGAVQTGMGDPVSKRGAVRGIVNHYKSAGRLGTVELEPDRLTDISPDGIVGLPSWAGPLSVMLRRAGWAWPAPVGSCLVAADADASRSGRREAPGAALAATGVPAATWSALALLVAGSGPGCAIEHRWPGAKAIFAAGGGRALRASAEVQRIVEAAVAGRPVRSGRVVVRDVRLAGAA